MHCGRSGFDPWVGKIPWRMAWQPTPVFLPGESPWTEKPGGLHSMGLQRVGCDWATSTQHTHSVLLVTQERRHLSKIVCSLYYFFVQGKVAALIWKSRINLHMLQYFSKWGTAAALPGILSDLKNLGPHPRPTEKDIDTREVRWRWFLLSVFITAWVI